VRLAASSSNVRLWNNVLWAAQGYVIWVADDSQLDFASDYNDLYFTGTGKLAQWQGVDFTSLADWHSALDQDLHSKSSDPQWADPDGPDNVLGFIAQDHGVDDDFRLRASSPAIDCANADIAPATDIQGNTRWDDPATPNTGNPPGTGYVDLGAYEFQGAGDTQPPQASLTAPDVTASGATVYTFTVTYTDNVAVKVSTLDNQDVQVTGPNSFSQIATLVSVDQNTDGTPRTATYQITPPGGSWDTADNGTYTVSVQATQVSDTTDHFMPSASLGDFAVNVAPNAPPRSSP
jgi:hypothetical protein